MKRLQLLVSLVVMSCGFATPAHACSMAGCLGGGDEMQRAFLVSFRHDDKPLAGVELKITGNGRDFTLVSSGDGRVHVENLPAGEYWLQAQLLGISAAYQCFHVADRPSSKAKRRLSFGWGDEAPAFKKIAGRLIDSQPSRSSSPLWNILHPVEVPIIGASLKLQDPISGEAYTTISDSQGEFAFDTIPAGTYVLHVEGGSAAGRDYDATDQLIALSPKATRSSILLKRSTGGGGSCGGTSLELVTAK